MHDSELRIQFGGELERLKKLGIKEPAFETYQIIFLPENIFSFKKRSELHDADDSLGIAKSLKRAGVICATALDLGLDVPVLERRSKDRWLGTVWIRDIIVIPIFVSVLGSLVATGVSDHFVKPKVHVELYIQRGANITKLSYNGDGDSLVKMLEAIKDK
jgi:hypothetical protein